MDNNNTESDNRRLGAAFLIVGWLIVIALVTVLINKTLFGTKQATVIISPSGSQITIPIGYDSHFRIDGSINNIPVTFLVDTGASAVTISSKLAQRASLPQISRINTMTANGETIGYLTNIAKLNLHGVELTNVQAMIIENLPADEALLGMNVLKRFTTQQTKDSLILTVPVLEH